MNKDARIKKLENDCQRLAAELDYIGVADEELMYPDLYKSYLRQPEQSQETGQVDAVFMWRSVDEEIPSIKQPVLMAVKCGSELKVEQGEYIGNNEWINCWFSKRGANTYPVKYWKPLEKPQAT